jgi:hypothetical protein
MKVNLSCDSIQLEVAPLKRRKKLPPSSMDVEATSKQKEKVTSPGKPSPQGKRKEKTKSSEEPEVSKARRDEKEEPAKKKKKKKISQSSEAKSKTLPASSKPTLNEVEDTGKKDEAPTAVEGNNAEDTQQQHQGDPNVGTHISDV